MLTFILIFSFDCILNYFSHSIFLFLVSDGSVRALLENEQRFKFAVMVK